jgi:long-chain fatty acid transport protein
LNIKIPQTWSDVTVFSVGGAYKYNDDLTLRLGGSFADNPVNGDSMLPTLAAIPKTHLTAGFSYETSDLSQLDFAFSWALEESQSNRSAPFNGAGTADTRLKANVAEYNFQIGYSWRF